ncbi:MAG: tail fiber domain-containing protein [Salinivirgaceae bacterium]|nr:tail fiber domain-containing protein [Salinivirgaceae bacterium]
MKKIRHFLVAVVTLLAATATMAQNGFNYQAVIRDNGEVISNQDVTLRISIMNGDAVCYQETQKTKTNAYGNITVSVGSGTATIGTFNAVPWATMLLTLKTEVDTDGSGNFVDMGQTPIQPVPFAQYAKKTSEIDNPSEIQIQAKANTGDDEALFAVKDEDGNVVFAVYKNGVRVYVDENDAKAAKSGFAVAGRKAKGEGNTYFAVNNEGTQVYVDDEGDKAPKSKFAVASVKSSSKDGENMYDNYLVINNEGTRVFVNGEDGNGKAPKSKFAVASVRSGKADLADDFFLINNEGTKVFIDETPASGKAPKSKFAVASVKKSKADANSNYLLIDSDSTRVYIDEANDGKAAKSGFAVAGKSASKGGDKNLFNIDLAKNAKTLNNENRVYWYPEKNAFLAGNLKVDSAAQVGANSFNAGYQNTASGNYSQAMGFMSEATGETSTAIGNIAKATGSSSFALGENSLASGNGSYAFGRNANATGIGSFAVGSLGSLDDGGFFQYGPAATGDFSFAIGPSTKAENKFSMALGFGNIASGDFSMAAGLWSEATNYSSIALGYYAKANGESSVALGLESQANGMFSTALGKNAKAIGYGSMTMGFESQAVGHSSTAIGYYTKSQSSYEFVVGSSNDTLVAGQYSDGLWSSDDRLFVIGNGLSDDTRSSALIVYKNGNTEFRGNVYPTNSVQNIWTGATSYDLGTDANRWNTVYANVINATNGEIQTSDKRLKTNIKPLERALDKVLTLNGVTYEWRVKEFPNKNFDSNRHVGVLAQELEAVLPEAVETGADGYKSVNYSNITPVLIEAIKEQNKKIEELEAKLKEMDELKRMVEDLMKKQ